MTAPTPTVLTTEIFTTMPDEFRKRDTLTSWSKLNRMGKPGDCFLEGPVFDRDGNLFVTDLEYGRIFRIDPQGGWQLVAEWDGEPNGLTTFSERELITTDFRNGLMIIDIASGAVTPFLDRRNTERFKGVNDLIFDSRGNLYFTDQGTSGMHDPTGRVYRLGVDGRLDALVTTAPSPNGLTLSPDENVLFVAMTRGNSVWRIPLMPDGGVAKVGVYLSVNGPAGPDGLATNVDGGLAVAIAGRGEAWILDERADPTTVLRSAAGVSVTNLAYGGPDRRDVYLTESATGSILRARVTVPGCPVPVGRP
jgi:gluconolactonase